MEVIKESGGEGVPKVSLLVQCESMVRVRAHDFSNDLQYNFANEDCDLETGKFHVPRCVND